MKNHSNRFEIANLLANAHIRIRKRAIMKWVSENVENSLDDVDTRGTVRTDSLRTVEKERTHAGSPE